MLVGMQSTSLRIEYGIEKEEGGWAPSLHEIKGQAEKWEGESWGREKLIFIFQ